MSLRARTALAALCALLALHSLPAAADYTPPPEPVHIPFEKGRVDMGRTARREIDRLVVRSMNCPEGALEVRASYAAAGSRSLAARRLSAVQRRIEAFGISASYAATPLQRAGAADALSVEVTAGGNEYCYQDSSGRLSPWVAEMAQQLAEAPGKLPAFWQLMTPEVRHGELALPLAEAAYCPGQPANCSLHPEVFAWLAEHVGRHQSAEERERWWLSAWSTAPDDELVRLKALLNAPSVPAVSRAWAVSRLATSRLDWDTIERRLREPEVMTALSQLPRSLAWPRETVDLIEAALQRGQLDRLVRLVNETDPASDRFAWAAVSVAASTPDEAHYKALSKIIPAWSRTVDGDAHLAQYLLLAAHCNDLMHVPVDPKRMQQIWDRLTESGWHPDPGQVREFTEAGVLIGGQRCLLEASSAEPPRYRRISGP